MREYYWIIIYSLLISCIPNSVWAMPTDAIVRELSNSVLRVKVKLPNGNLGLGSAVVIANNQVITNCHVVNTATHVEVIVSGKSYTATAIKTDWHHDLCMLTVENINLPVVKFGTSKNLQYDSAIFTVGYPGETKEPVSTFGEVKGLFPLDDSVIIRASSAFRLGASGGGAFDDTGNLVGIITLKSRGNNPYYYFMPVEWVQALMAKPAQVMGEKSEPAFWAMPTNERPYFMQVVPPYVAKEWKILLRVATSWVQSEPKTAESWFYLAAAEYAMNDFEQAKAHFKKVLEINDHHSQAIDYLEKIAQKTVKTNLAINQKILLN